MRKHLLLAAALAAGCCMTVHAQSPSQPQYGGVDLGNPKPKKDKKPTTRNLKGTVVDEQGRPVRGALVTLTNVSKGEKITFITKDDGRYNFDDVPFRVDYEVSARSGNLHSANKKLTQYDDTANMVRILEVAPSKDEEKK